MRYEIGSRFHRLVVVSYSGTADLGRAVVKCDCGTTKSIRLRQWGRIKSCGCYPRGRRPGQPTAPLVGRVFGKLTVLESRIAVRDGVPQEHREVVVRCECGTVKTVLTSNIYTSTRSCGCISGGLPTRFGVPRWHPMRDLFFSHRLDMTEEWRSSFDAFVRDIGKRQNGLEFTKIRQGEPYGPSNFSWAPHNAVTSKSKKAIQLEHDGVVRSIAQWAATCGLSRQALCIRLKKMSLAAALTLPRRPDAPISAKAKCKRCKRILDATAMDVPGGRVHQKCWRTA